MKPIFETNAERSAACSAIVEASTLSLSSSVQTSCFAGAAQAARGTVGRVGAPRRGAPHAGTARELERGSRKRSKIKGRGTPVPAKPVCTWGGGGTRLAEARAAQSPRAASMAAMLRACYAGMRPRMRGSSS